ncbi:DUF3592 domain-containing protein [Candidatus Venteria ishoeyi]|uniref:DUF3592 domain-containing protein n=1 Tax=Candidatus Venteria ishoeyi TaxID=1899563 RepID=A0A1H6F992_9GAMM|nr:DUF3592 domain-containing protein [Candidatus Venteria ishoeyi]SEH05869.1 Uncharacterised protein [Candidatus Venteria ishoeyi]
MKVILHFVFAGLSLAVFAGLSLYFIHMAWYAWQLEQALDTRGVMTTASITACHPGSKSTPVEFEYHVADANGNKRLYQGRNQGGGGSAAKCQRGKTIVVRYLPEAPEQVQHSRSADLFFGIIGSIAALTILLVLIRLMIKEGIVPKT